MLRHITLRKALIAVASSAAMCIPAVSTPVQAAAGASQIASHEIHGQHATLLGAHWEFVDSFPGSQSGAQACESEGRYWVAHGTAISYQCIYGDPHAGEWNLWVEVLRSKRLILE